MIVTALIFASMRPRLAGDRNDRRQRQLLFCATDRSTAAAAR